MGINSTVYTWPHIVDTADTNANGGLIINDTIFSDTFALFNALAGDTTYYRYLNAVYYLYDFDTGSVLDDDSVLDTVTVAWFTTWGGESPSYQVYLDTVVAVPCTVRHHLILDTLMYKHFYVRSIVWDSLNPTTNDTNTYSGWLEAFAGGTRED
ncbi:MAG: hypothetical protein ACFFCW_01830 [Candidatus Hodarchaeota archaeon]